MKKHRCLTLKEATAPSKHCITIGNKSILVCVTTEGIYALENKCSHAMKPLNEGKLKITTIQCPFHGAVFCLKTGDHLAPPAFKGIQTYPVEIINDVVYVDLSGTDAC